MNFSEFLQPAIFGLTGKPGAGKSYFATRLILAEIKEQNRPIVSNVPINQKALREYVKKDFYYYPLDTYSDNKAFFTNRGYYNIEVENLGSNVDFKPLLKEDDEGVLFIIDEAQLYFNARNWKHMPQATMSYISTIRHVGDSLIWMCQKYSDIDSQIRGKTQAFHVLRNLSKEKIGMFKRGTGFRCYQYLEENHISAHGGDIQRASQDFTYPFDLKVAECYSTSLFNKDHDKKYKVRAIPLKYLIWAICLVFAGVIYWVGQGGIQDTIAKFVLGQSEEIEVSEKISLKDSNVSLPIQDPFDEIVTVPQLWKETPTLFSSGQSQMQSSPWELLPQEDFDRKKEYWFGKNTKCKITFISDKVTKESKTDFSFGAIWSKFASFNNISLSSEGGIWQMQTNYFTSFINYIRDNGQGANLKETDLILKENVDFDLTHGYQLPYEDSIATQGVIRSSRNYKEVGFMLQLRMEMIDDKQMLRILVENTDVMDITSSEPILQTFKSTNVLDVTDGMTYQIADFRSLTSQVTKGIFKKSDYSTQITNKIFLTYGNN